MSLFPVPQDTLFEPQLEWCVDCGPPVNLKKARARITKITLPPSPEETSKTEWTPQAQSLLDGGWSYVTRRGIRIWNKDGGFYKSEEVAHDHLTKGPPKWRTEKTSPRTGETTSRSAPKGTPTHLAKAPLQRARCASD